MSEDVRAPGAPLAALFWDLHSRRGSGRVRLSTGEHGIELSFAGGRLVAGCSSFADSSPVGATGAKLHQLLKSALAMQSPLVSFQPEEVPDPGARDGADRQLFDLLREALERDVDPGLIAESLRPFSERPVQHSELTLDVLRSAPLSPEERRVLLAIDGRAPIGELARRSGLALHRVLRILYLAWCCKAIRFGSERAEAGAEHTTWYPREPPPLPAPIRARRSGAEPPLLDPDRAHEEAVTAALALEGYFSRGIIGRGGWGTVHRAYHERLDRMVAIKVPARELLRDDEARDRFVLEARNAGRLMHPNIVVVHDCNSRDGILYLVMELLEGRTTKQIVEKGGPLPTRAALGIARAVAVAIEHAHRRDVLHRDVKPDNVFVSQTGDVKLADWGLAALLGATMRSRDETAPLGTPAYMSPEQIRSDPVDSRTDIYSFGALLHFLVTGKPPYEARSMVELIQQQLLAPPPDARRIDARLSDALAGVIWVAMAKEPSDRYQTAAELIAAIDELLAP